MLFSEIGCEGLDYQFCDCIVNYDLPWNPMRVEQRIGRIDRNGQQSETVAIVNLITPGTVDADIYERCLVRIGVFESGLGGSEEILGDISKEIKNIAENYALSEEERRLKLRQLADNKIRLVREDRVKTGRFGVGFKSVFAFTATPIIISDCEHFKIYGLYCVKEHPYPDDLPRFRTRIILPFNHESEKPNYMLRAYTKIMSNGRQFGLD